MATIDSLELKATPLTTDTIELNDGQKAALGSLPVTTAQTADTVAKIATHAALTDAHGATAANTASRIVARSAGGTVDLSGVQLDTAATPTQAAGMISWDAVEETAQIGVNASEAISVGTELSPRYRNTSGSTMANGTAVYITGATGSNTNIGLAKADALATCRSTIGIVTTDAGITNNGFGRVCTYGVSHNHDTSAYTAGDILWVSTTTAGAFTNVEPTVEGTFKMRVGSVQRAHATQGEIFVDPEFFGSVTGDAVMSAVSKEAAREAIDAASSLQGSTIYVDATNGNDSTAARGTTNAFLSISAAVSASQAGDTIILRAGTYSTGKLTLSSNITLQGSGRLVTIIRLADATNDYLVVNEDQTNGNTGITFRDLTFDGNKAGQVALSMPPYAAPVYLKKVDNLRVENVTVKDPFKFSFHIAGCNYPVIRDLYFDIGSPTINNDGLHVNGPSVGGIVDGLYGTVGDDTLALNAVDGGPEMLIWGRGEISGWTVRNIHCGTGAFRAVRLLAGKNGSTREDVKDIIIENVTGTFSFPCISFTELGSEANYSNVKISEISGYSSTGSCVVVEDGAIVHDTDLNFNYRGTSPQAMFMCFGYVKTAIVGGTYIDESSSIGGAFTMTGASGARIDNLTLANPVFKASTASAQYGVYSQFGSIGNVCLIGANFFNVRNPVLFANASNGYIENATVIGGIFDYSSNNTNGIVTIAGSTAFNAKINIIGVRANKTYLVRNDISTAITGCLIRESGSLITNSPSGNDTSLIGGVAFRFISDVAKLPLATLTPSGGDAAVSDGSGGYTSGAHYIYNGTAWSLLGKALTQADISGLTTTSNVQFGNILAAITGASVITGQGTTEANVILKDTGFTSGLQTFGLNWNGGVLTFRRMNDAANSVTSTPMILDIATGNLRLTGSLGVGNSATATTLGTVTRKVEVFNASGASLGFIPVYDAIT